MKITAAQVKKLRDQTACPMMDCKNALAECDGDVDAAVDYLRKKGIASAQKRTERITGEGSVAGYISEDGRRAALVEIKCETDFVAKNESFRNLAIQVARVAADTSPPPSDTAALLGATALDGDKSVEEMIKAEFQTLKENMNLRRFLRFDVPAESPGCQGMYVHFNGKIGTLVELALSDPALAQNEAVQVLLKDLCMHVTHSAPLGLSRADIPTELVDKERAVLADLDEVKKKPEKIRPKIVEGKLSKFFQENSLLDQEFVKEKKVSIKKLLDRVSTEVGGEISITRFGRLSVGE
jgi:elongation factor Ts